MGGRGAENSGRIGGGGGVNPNNIESTTSLVSAREAKRAEVDETLSVFRDFKKEYGSEIEDIEIATLKGKDKNGTLAYYQSGLNGNGNIAINTRYFDSGKMEKAYDECVRAKYHPSRGNKTAMQAVVAHEIGHQLTDIAGKNMGLGKIAGLKEAATKIVNEARQSTNHRGVVQMARKISEYATASNAETVAEAVADVYCNGNGAKSESKAIVNVLKKYI